MLANNSYRGGLCDGVKVLQVDVVTGHFSLVSVRNSHPAMTTGWLL